MSTHSRQQHSPDTWDVIVIGGGAAGLSAALMLGRARRRVLVVDEGLPRNRFAAHMHGVLGNEGADPADLLRRGRDEVRGYGVTVRTGSVTEVHDDDEAAGLTVHLTDAAPAHTRALVVASGQTDALPDIPGLSDFWGTSVLHCPYCHGWEVRGQRLAVLGTSEMATHQAQLVRQWSDDLVFLTAGIGGADPEIADRLRSRGVRIEDTAVEEVLSRDGRLSGIRLADGRDLAVDAIFAAPTALPHVGFLDSLGLERTTTPMGTALATDQFGATSHPRIWAVGNVANPGATVPVSMAAGSMAGGVINMTLVTEDFDRALAGAGTPPEPSASSSPAGSATSTSASPAEHWEGEYAGKGLRWSGAANATTAAVVETLPAGHALELGCGEGGDAIWMAEQGWQVTAVDISPTATARGAEAAADRGVSERIDWVAHDLSTWTTDERYDLVTASFFHSNVDLPRTEILRRAAGRLRLGGHLLLVSHVFESEADIPPWANAQRDHDGHGNESDDHHDHGQHGSRAEQGGHRGTHHDLPTPAEELSALALDPAEWEVVLEEIRGREAVGPDGVQTATLKDGVVLVRRRP